VRETVIRLTREMMHISDNVFYISLAVLIFILCLIIVYWFYTRKRMRELQHQIPATVLKNYLDSVIQNSNALKSSLFRGGGLDASDGIPSVVPTGSLPTGNVGVGGSEDLAQKNAEISALQGQLGTKDSQIRELERQLSERVVPSGDSSEEVQIMQSELDKLRAELASKQTELEAAQSANVGGDGGAEVEALQKEKTELQDRLKEYEIIEEDLANLRRLQQENDQLKQTIEQLQGGAPAPAAEATPEPAPAPEPEAAPEPEPAPEPAPAPAEEEDLEAAMAAAIEEAPATAPPADAVQPEPAEEPAAAADDEMMVPSNEGEQKSAEELLSEFEKMLG